MHEIIVKLSPRAKKISIQLVMVACFVLFIGVFAFQGIIFGEKAEVIERENALEDNNNSINDVSTEKDTEIAIEDYFKDDTALDKVNYEDTDYVQITDFIPDAVIDLKYAGTDNFTSCVIYNFDQAYLRYGTVKKLMEAADELRQNGYRIKIWDAYRPFEAQKFLFQVYPDPIYVADPANGPKSHNLGGTLDMTLCDMDGNEIEMPTTFDDFSYKANRDYSDCSNRQRENALLLENTMLAHGFTAYSGEWWDFSDTTDYSYEDFVPPVNEFLDSIRSSYQTEMNDKTSDSTDAPASAGESNENPENNASQGEISVTTTDGEAVTNSFEVGALQVAQTTNQLIIIAGTGGYDADVTMYLQNGDGSWYQYFTCDGDLGKSGIGNANEYVDFSPVGVHAFSIAFGIRENPGCTMPYTQVDDFYYWVDDVNSVYYNQLVSTNTPGVAGSFTSAEHLIEISPAYNYALALDYNSQCIPGNGSAFFLHCKGNASYTAGCVAIPEENMIMIMQVVNANCKIVIDYGDNIVNY